MPTEPEFQVAASDDVGLECAGLPRYHLSQMGRDTRQGEVGVVIDGKYYGITDFSAE